MRDWSPDLVRETRSLWERLGESGLPIYLYGMGDGADKIRRALERYGLAPAGVFASDGFVRGHAYAGFPVERYSAVRERHGDGFTALLAFGVNYEPMLSVLTRMETECRLYAPDVPVIWDGTLFDRAYLEAHSGEFAQVWAALGDDCSRRVLLDVLSYKISGRIFCLRQSETPLREGWSLLNLAGGEAFVDLGAYTGDTIQLFLEHSGGSGRILALEPDPKNFRKLERNLSDWGVPADCRRLGAWSGPGELRLKTGRGGRNPLLGEEGVPVPVNAVDNLLAGARADLIKLDVEGAEAQALAGAAHTIAAWKPRLILSAYHRNEDLFSLPLQLLKICPGYRLYLRHHPCIPAWDTCYYCIPE